MKALKYLLISLMLLSIPIGIGFYMKPEPSYQMPYKTVMEITKGDMAYAEFYDYEPMGTRKIKDSDQIIRSNFHSLYKHLDVEHNIIPGTYGGTTSYDESGTYGHHDEGSARIYFSSSAPASNEEGRMYMDSDTYYTYVAGTDGTWHSMINDEVVTARGSAASLDDRLDVLLSEGGTFTPQSDLNMGGYRLLMLDTVPVSGAEAASKSYVDMVRGTGGSHAQTHTDGTDDIRSASSTAKGLMLSSHVSSLEDVYRKMVILEPKAKYREHVTVMLGDYDNAPSATTVGYSAALAFDPNTDQIGYYTAMLEDSSYSGGDISIVVSYSMEGSATSGDLSSVEFRIGYLAVAADEQLTAPGYTGELVANWSMGLGSTLVNDTTSFEIDNSYVEDNDMIAFKLYRNADSTTADWHPGYLYIHDIWLEED